VGQKKVCGSK